MRTFIFRTQPTNRSIVKIRVSFVKPRVMPTDDRDNQKYPSHSECDYCCNRVAPEVCEDQGCFCDDKPEDSVHTTKPKTKIRAQRGESYNKNQYYDYYVNGKYYWVQGELYYNNDRKRYEHIHTGKRGGKLLIFWTKKEYKN